MYQVMLIYIKIFREICVNHQIMLITIMLIIINEIILKKHYYLLNKF